MAGTKRHPASEAKKRRTREKGQVASSVEVVHVAVLVVLLELVIHLMPKWAAMIGPIVVDVLDRASADPSQWPVLGAPALLAGVSVAAMALLPAVAAGVLVGARVNGFLFAPKALAPDPKRMDPVSSAKNLFGEQGLSRSALVVLKMAVLIPIGVVMLRNSLPSIVSSWSAPIWAGPKVLELTLVPLLRVGEAVLVVFAIVDYWVARIMHRRQNRMDDEEFRRDYREAFGDPLVKGQQRALFMEFLQDPVGLPKGIDPDVIFVNPTHRAVGLVYRKGIDKAPRVVFSRADAAAHDTVHWARGRRLPIVRSPGFTRALFAEAVPGRTVPQRYWKSLAIVYRMLEELEREGELQDIEVREEVLLAELSKHPTQPASRPRGREMQSGPDGSGR
jgi:type III secretion protein U